MLKAQSPDLCHKSDIGGVVLNVVNGEALTEAWQRLHDDIQKACPISCWKVFWSSKWQQKEQNSSSEHAMTPSRAPCWW
jgi:hypothetical protein